MDDARNSKKIYQANLHFKRTQGRPKAGWKDVLENDTWRMGMNWRKEVQDRDGWRCWGGAYPSWRVQPQLKRKILQFFPLPCNFFVLNISMVTREDRLAYHGLGI